MRRHCGGDVWSDRHRSRPAFAPQSAHHPAKHYYRRFGAYGRNSIWIAKCITSF